MTRLSYAHGACDQPLIGETIGAEPRADGRARVPDATRWSPVTRACATVRRVRRGGRPAGSSGMLAGGLGQGRPRRHVEHRTAPSGSLVQYATAKLGVILVNINPAYRTSELEYALGQSGCRCDRRAGVQDSDYVDDGRRRCAPKLRARAAVFFDTDDWDELRAPATRSPGDELRARAASWTSTSRSTSSTRAAPRLPQGRDAHPPQHPQQRLLRRRGAAATPSATGCASRCRFTTASGW